MGDMKRHVSRKNLCYSLSAEEPCINKIIEEYKRLKHKIKVVKNVTIGNQNTTTINNTNITNITNINISIDKKVFGEEDLCHLTKDAVFKDMTTHEPRVALQKIIAAIYAPGNSTFICDKAGNYFVVDKFVDTGPWLVPIFAPRDKGKVLEDVCTKGYHVMDDAFYGATAVTQLGGRFHPRDGVDTWKRAIGEDGYDKVDTFLASFSNKEYAFEEATKDAHETSMMLMKGIPKEMCPL